MEPLDTLIHARWIAPVEPADTVLCDHALAIHDGRIVALMPSAEADARYNANKTYHLDGSLLIPGLVNAHTHAAMSLLRGLADDLPLMEWLGDHIWPAEARWVSADFVRDGTRLAVAEMIRGGTTCFNDMYFFPDVTAQVSNQAGIRAVVGLIVIDSPTVWAADIDEYLARGTRVHDDCRAMPLVTTAFAPHSPYTVSDASLQRVRTLAHELDIPIHMHVHETAQEVADAVSITGERPLARLDRLGLLAPRLLAVHMTELDDSDIERVVACGTHVVHCPESNLKLASGMCPVGRLREAGVNVALGTDGAASNNDLDMIGEMRTAALLAKGVAGSASTLPAFDALRMATLDGARALGLDAITGSLVAGKSADVVAVDLDQLETQPVYDPMSSLVYASTRQQMSHVWVAGRPVLDERRLLTLDEGELRATAMQWRDRIRA